MRGSLGLEHPALPCLRGASRLLGATEPPTSQASHVLCINRPARRHALALVHLCCAGPAQRPLRLCGGVHLLAAPPRRLSTRPSLKRWTGCPGGITGTLYPLPGLI